MFSLIIATFIYFLPTIIAAHRGHNIAGIALLNFFFGWTGIGWLAMLLWALVSRPSYCCLAPPYSYHPYYGWRR